MALFEMVSGHRSRAGVCCYVKDFLGNVCLCTFNLCQGVLSK